MSNLTTRKIVLGMLMVLVLALGVLGNAEALKFGDHTTSDGDLRTVYQNQDFTIWVPVSPKGPEIKPGWKQALGQQAKQRKIKQMPVTR